MLVDGTIGITLRNVLLVVFHFLQLRLEVVAESELRFPCRIIAFLERDCIYRACIYGYFYGFLQLQACWSVRDILSGL